MRLMAACFSSLLSVRSRQMSSSFSSGRPRQAEQKMPARVDQAGEATGGVGTAGETEQIDLVAGVVVVTEKAEAVDDVGIQSCSAEAAANLLSIAGTHTAAVVEDLAGAPAVHRWYGAQQLDHIGDLVALVVGVPGAVQAQDKAAGHICIPVVILWM